jgi:hypothetical protein
VVFTLPLVGDEPVAPDTVFLVQFSSYMDEDTFEDRVRLRYGDLPEPQGELRGARWRYDEVKRTLVVDPGARAAPGRGRGASAAPGHHRRVDGAPPPRARGHTPGRPSMPALAGPGGRRGLLGVRGAGAGRTPT